MEIVRLKSAGAGEALSVPPVWDRVNVTVPIVPTDPCIIFSSIVQASAGCSFVTQADGSRIDLS